MFLMMIILISLGGNTRDRAVNNMLNQKQLLPDSTNSDTLCSTMPEANEPKAWKMTTALTAVAGTVVIMDRYYRSEPWWPHRSSPTLMIDNKYAGMVDKMGHILAANLITKAQYELYKWTGMNNRSAAWWAFGSTVFMKGLWEFAYESRGANFGFGADVYDFTADVLGAGLVVLAEYLPSISLAIKWSFTLRTNPPYNREHKFTNDYQGQTYWLTLDIPTTPKWISLAIGLNRSDWRQHQGHNQWWVSPDINWVKLAGDHWWTRLLNSLKLPSPKIQVHPHFMIKGVAWSN